MLCDWAKAVNGWNPLELTRRLTLVSFSYDSELGTQGPLDHAISSSPALVVLSYWTGQNGRQHCDSIFISLCFLFVEILCVL